MTHRLGKTVLHTCLQLFTPVHTCSHLFTPVHTCSHLSDYLHCSRNGSFSLNFPFGKAIIFDLTCYLVAIAYLCSPNRELPNGVWLVYLDRKKYRSLWQPILQCMLVTKCHFLHFQMLLFFSLTSYPAEIAYFNSPN